MLIVFIFGLFIGFAGLVKGADFFVEGSIGIAKYLNVPGLIIGLTIVAFGTSMPELAVSTVAAVRGSNEIALSNVLGSNIFNLLTVIGCCALISPVPSERSVLVRDIPVSVAAALIIFLSSGAGSILINSSYLKEMSIIVGLIGRIHGFILVILFIAYIVCVVKKSKGNNPDNSTAETVSMKKCAALAILGLAMIIVGGQAVVAYAQKIAAIFGMTETLIGLTVVAVGTSLPELVTSIVAARKNQTDLAVGNAIGSNIFNLMFILGISSLLNPIKVNAASAYDILILIVVSMVVLAFFSISGRLNRIHGLMMVGLYFAYLMFAILRK